ncbi:MAG: tetratricopeptide repeat protein, partial [Acidobacteria bacterium]|nr:tetratricopeptide repeat protein [Acidobacteriota bacterium]
LGTVGYMSPEQAQGRTNQIDHRSDIFSFGCILFEAVTGCRAFEGKDAIDTLNKIIREPVPTLREVRIDTPDHLQRIVRRCLAKDRDDRYQTIKDVAIELRELRHDMEGNAFHTTVPPMTSQTTGAEQTQAVGSAQTESGAKSLSTHPSSAEYIVSRIKQHKLAAAITVVVLVLGAIGMAGYFHARNSEVAIDSIAVLPFQNRSTEPDSEYLSDGLAESLIYRLSQLPNLKVSPTSSVFRYKSKEVDPIKVGEELGVSAVLVGRMVQRGDNLTISAELVDVRQNKLLWGEQYERKMSEVLQTHREIAREIVEKLKLKVSGEKALAKHYTESNDAYQLYMKGRLYWNKRTSQGLHKSVEYYEQAIARDPNFALAYAGLADSYSLLGGPEAGGDMRPNEVLPKAKTAALRAIEIDGSLAEPHVSLGHVSYFYDRDWTAAEREFKRAIELNPNYAVAHHWYAIFLSTFRQRIPEALVEIRRALELDPTSLIINAWYGRLLVIAGQFDQAIEQLKKTVELDPNFNLAHLRLGQAYAEKEMYNEAIDEFNKVLNLPDGRTTGLMGLAYAYALAGRKQEAQQAFDELIGLSKQQFVSPSQLAIIHIARGEKDKAFERLEEANRLYDLNIMRLKVERRFDPLRSDPRFDDLVRRIGIP